MTQSESVSVKAEHKQASIRDTVSCSEILWIQSKSKAESPHWHTNQLPIIGPAEVSAEWITPQRFPALFGECCHSNTKLKANKLWCGRQNGTERKLDETFSNGNYPEIHPQERQWYHGTLYVLHTTFLVLGNCGIKAGFSWTPSDVFIRLMFTEDSLVWNKTAKWNARKIDDRSLLKK